MPNILSRPENPLPPQEVKPAQPNILSRIGGYLANDSLPVKMAKSAWSGLTAPGDAWAGKIAPEDMERRAWDMGGLVTGMAGGVPAEGAELRTGMNFPLLHGSPKAGLTELNPSTGGALGAGTYATPMESIARRYAGDAGTVYTLPEKTRNIFNGLGDRYGEYDDWKADKAALLGAVEPEMRDTIGSRIEKSWTGDGYPLFRSIAADYRDRSTNGLGEPQATELFKRAGFEGISGHADGPEVVLFGKQPLEAAAGTSAAARDALAKQLANHDWFAKGGT